MVRIRIPRAVAIGALTGATIFLPLVAVRVFAANPAIVVNDAADVVDFDPGDGVCETAAGNGVCTLRAAVMEANQLPGADTIKLGAQEYSLSIPSGVEPNAALGDLNITGALTIDGEGEGSTIVEASATSWQDAHYRIFNTENFAIDVTFTDMTIRRGHDGFGGAVGLGNQGSVVFDHVLFTDNHADGIASGSGGAIYNWTADLTLTNDEFVDNHVWSGGGAVVSTGDLTVRDSVFTDNHASLGGGGAIWVDGHATVLIERSEISYNTAADIYGGGLHVGTGSPYDDAHVTVSNSSLAWNSGNSAAMVTHPNNSLLIESSTLYGNGPWSLSGPSISIGNSIVANTDVDHCGGWTITSLGHNIFDDNSCTMVASDVVADPLLAPLANNGGPTRTLALKPGSPAVDAGANCPSVDQRSVARPIDGDQDNQAVCDIGAYEADEGTNQPPVPTPAPTGAPTSAPTDAPTGAPTSGPTPPAPTDAPTAAPPTVAPPTAAPPTSQPTSAPTDDPKPTHGPKPKPSDSPGPTDAPSLPPPPPPTGAPTDAPKPTDPASTPLVPETTEVPTPPTDDPGLPPPTDDPNPPTPPAPTDDPEPTFVVEGGPTPTDDVAGSTPGTPKLTMPPTSTVGEGGTDQNAPALWASLIAVLTAAGVAMAFDRRTTQRSKGASR